MSDALAMRDLARRLLTYEAAMGNAPAPTGSTMLLAYAKLRHSLIEFVGVAGFQSLALRALILAKAEAPLLGVARIAADGSLEGLSEMDGQTDIDKDQAGEAGIHLIAGLLGLLRMFLGEALTLSLLRNAWPGEVFDDDNAVNGRKA